MSRKRILLAFLLGALLAGVARDAATGAKCGGKFFNPVSDVAWRAMFPIKIGGIKVTPGEGTDTVNHFPLCFCGSPVPRVGIKVSFWEPVKLVEVVRHPGYFPSLGGRKLPLPSFAMAGAYGEGGGSRFRIDTQGHGTRGTCRCGERYQRIGRGDTRRRLRIGARPQIRG